jgi:NAD-dependent deacetylase
VLTGAGISAESGLKTFRDAGGLWEGHRVEDVATPEAFLRNPCLVYDFYNQRRLQLFSPEVRCNQAHKALAEFESQHDGMFTLITQNVDDLHQRAGSKNVFPMHGELRKARCSNCKTIQACDVSVDQASVCIFCGEKSMRPHIVWFGEMPLFMQEIEAALASSDLFVAIGTSSAVYPAAGFYHTAKQIGAKTVELNLQPSDQASNFDEAYYGVASKVVPEFFSGLLKA